MILGFNSRCSLLRKSLVGALALSSGVTTVLPWTITTSSSLSRSSFRSSLVSRSLFRSSRGSLGHIGRVNYPTGLGTRKSRPCTTIPRGGDIRRWRMTTTTTDSVMTASNDTDAATVTTTTTTPSPSPLARLRSLLIQHQLDCYLVPTDDPHLSEYVSEAYGRRAFISGFDGSAGTAIVFAGGRATLNTDGRYWNQAGLQLDSNEWELLKQNETPDTPSVVEWVVQRAEEKKKTGGSFVVGLDPFVHPASFCKELREALRGDDDEDTQLGFVETSHGNLVDVVWGEARPAVPQSPFAVHPLQYAGVSVTDKLTEIREQMTTKDPHKKATLLLLTALDEVAYLYNLRSLGDVFSCPVGIAYATVEHDRATLYCDREKLTDEVRTHLDTHRVEWRPYQDVADAIRAHLDHPPATDTPTPVVWLDTTRCNEALASLVPSHKQLLDQPTPVSAAKAVKNDAELDGMRRAHLVDGVAMAKFISWLEHRILVDGEKVSEVEIDLRLTGERAKQPGWKEVSFNTIAGVAGNGAIIHYRAEENELMKYLDKETPILIDSGGQYEYGTTDVTRTWYFGDNPSDELKEAYTRVLKGHIGLDTMIFPENTPGFVLDVMARQHLWSAGWDYGHGTGHGVGAALNVHEGPMSVSPRWKNTEVLHAGMVLSNEPGYYKDGTFGVRIENLVVIREKLDLLRMKRGDQGKRFFGFEKLTLIPIQKTLMKQELLTDKEMDWLDEYHEEVLKKVGPLLEDGSPEKEWLVKNCENMAR